MNCRLKASLAFLVFIVSNATFSVEKPSVFDLKALEQPRISKSLCK